MKVIIAGTRSINDYKLVVTAIKRSGFVISEVVSGCAIGVDRLGEQWALANNIPVTEIPANWKLHHNAAGPIRNKEMAEYADAAIIIWDGQSRGTRNMIENMVRRDKPYHIGITSATLEDFI